MATFAEIAVCYIKSKKFFERSGKAIPDRANAVKIIKALGDHIGDPEAEKILTIIEDWKTYPLERDGG